LHVACRAGNLAAMEEYIGEFESLERSAKGCTPLLTACMHGHEAIVAFLLEKGAKPDVVRWVRIFQNFDTGYPFLTCWFSIQF